ncbi:hypothetical protein [Pseudomonas helleri]|uniref:hypothetical protein n=1 Tax=Pseudomonas helleri TaxID=1608996 RepID=UPI003F962B6F
MSLPNWNAILPSLEAIQAMTPEKLKATEDAADRYIGALAHGISGIGNLLACTASNSESGLNEGAVADVGWLLESLGGLIGNLYTTEAAAAYRRNEVERGGA